MDNQVTEPKHSAGAIVTVVVLTVIGLAIGFGIGRATASSNNNSNTNATAPTTSTKAADLRSDLVTLGVQHMNLVDQAVDSALDGQSDADAMKAELIKNGQDISAAVGSVYGKAAQDQFQAIWNVHLTDFVKYAVAAKTGDQAGKKAALDDIDANYTKPISKLLAGANPNLPEATLETAFGDHVQMTATMIDDHVAANYTQETADREMAVKHIEGIMSTLAGAIVKQYPNKF